MDVKPIRTEDDYRWALAHVDRLLRSEPGSPEGDWLDVLVVLIEDYERQQRTERRSDPIGAILAAMDRLDLEPRDLEPYIGSRSRVWEILNRRRLLTLPMMRKLSVALDIDMGTLAQEYPLGEQRGSIAAAEVFSDDSPCEEVAQATATVSRNLRRATSGYWLEVGSHNAKATHPVQSDMLATCSEEQGVRSAAAPSVAATEGIRAPSWPCAVWQMASQEVHQ